MTNRRRYYRLRYPKALRPPFAVCVDGRWHALAELSECGLRFVAGDDLDVRPGDRVPVVVRLDDEGETWEIEDAVALRRDGDEIVLCFDHGVPVEAVFREQRRLIRDARERKDPAGLDALRPPAFRHFA